MAYETFLENPLFGYGITAWDRAFRAKLNMPFAFHAHNQVMQSLSVGGLLGALGLVFYLTMLSYYSLRLARFTRGLAPALLALILVRSISEVPLDVTTLLAGDFVTHLCLFMVLAGSAAMVGRHAAAPAPARINAWVTAPASPAFAPARSVADDADVDERALGAIVRVGAGRASTRPAAPPNAFRPGSVAGPVAPYGMAPGSVAPAPGSASSDTGITRSAGVRDRADTGASPAGRRAGTTGLPESLVSAPWPPPRDGRQGPADDPLGKPSAPTRSATATPRIEPRFDDQA